MFQKDFTVIWKNRIKRCCKFFSVDFNSIDTNDILDTIILIKRTWHNIMFGLIKNIFNGLLTSLVNGSYHTKCTLLSNQKCEIQPILINLHSNEYNEISIFGYIRKMSRCAESCNTIIELSNKACVPNKTEDLNLCIFKMMTWIHELKTLKKHISCKCKCRFDRKKCNSNQWWNNDKCWCACKKLMYMKKMFGTLVHVIWIWKIFSKYYGWFSNCL